MEILVKLAGGTEFVQTELVRTELVGTELVGTELVTKLKARVEVRQLEALEALLITVRCWDSLES